MIKAVNQQVILAGSITVELAAIQRVKDPNLRGSGYRLAYVHWVNWETEWTGRGGD